MGFFFCLFYQIGDTLVPPAGSSNDGTLECETDPTSLNKPGLRLILLGPAGGGRTSLAETLLGNTNGTRGHMGPLMESTKRQRVMDGRDVTVVDTPDILGPSLGNSKKAMEALRSLQLTSPGPHAFLLVIPAPGSSVGTTQDAAQEIRTTLELFGDKAAGHIIPVLTHSDYLGRTRTVDQMLEVDAGGLKTAVSLCDQRPELVDNRPGCPSEVQTRMRRQLMGRVMEVETLRGHFVHELQRKEDRVREELLADMASALARKLGHQ